MRRFSPLLAAVALLASAPLLSAAHAPPATPATPVSTSRGAPIATVTIAPDTGTLTVGDTVALTATVRDVNSAVIARAAVTWGVSNPDVAGVVARTTAGSAAIIARAVGTVNVDATSRGVTGTAVFRVIPQVVAQVPGDTTPVDTATPLPPITPPAAPTGVTVAVLPQDSVVMTMPTQTGATIRVAAGGNLQTAINTAVAGDVIELAAGATFTGNFILPKRTADSTGWVVIRAEPSVAVPAQGVRIDPDSVTNLPKIVSPNASPAVQLAAGSAGWRFVGVEITTTAASIAYDLVRLGDGQATSLAQVPSRIVLDRVYAHGLAALHLQRCVTINSARTAVVDSYLADCHTKGQEGQGIGGWASPGPVRVENNYIEGGTIGMIVGGADPKITGLIPSDYIVRHNHFVKPLAWKGVWSAKNAFELKNARRVLLEGNVLENNWVDAQNGFIVLFQALTQYNTAPWTTISDVTVRYNVIRNAPAGINILSRVAYAYGGSTPVLPDSSSKRFVIQHNVFENIGAAGSGNGRFIQLGTDLEDVTITHNTSAPSASHSTLAFALAAQVPTGIARLTFTNNVAGRGTYGIIGDSYPAANTALARYAPGAVVTGNVFYGAGFTASVIATYPTGNGYYLSASAAGLTTGSLGALGSLTYAVPASGLVTSGVVAGADFAAVTAATAGVVVP